MMFKKVIQLDTLAVRLIISLLILLFTYKSFEPDLAPGLDSSYVWALNYLFIQDFTFLQNIIYPLGPLGFLLMPAPLDHNLLWATIFKLAVQWGFVFSLLQLGKKNKAGIYAIMIAFVASWMANLDVLLTGLVLMLFYEGCQSNSYRYFLMAAFFSAMACLIKSSFGIAIHTMMASGTTWQWFVQRDKKQMWQNTLLFYSFYLFLTLLMLGGFKNVAEYHLHILRLAGSYGDAMALFPNKPHGYYVLIWIMLIYALILDKKHAGLSLLLLFPLFAFWKHSIVREEYFHNRIMLSFLPFAFGLLILEGQKKWPYIILGAASIFLYYQNLKLQDSFKPYNFKENRARAFYHSVIDYKNFNKQNFILSEQNLSAQKLPDTVLSIIGKRSVDIYPTELSLIPANKLNYHPRRTLQSGGFGSWLDQKNAEAFGFENGPEIVLWHLNYSPEYGNVLSFDQRNIFNDEPLTILRLLSNYQLRYSSSQLLVLEKRKEALQYNITSNPAFSIAWNQWINVPTYEKGLLRLQVNESRSLFFKTQQILYKGDEYFIDYKMDNGEIQTYRFVMSNAADGLWLNPFLNKLFDCSELQKVEQFRIRHGGRAADNKLTGNFQYIEFKQTTAMPSVYFNCSPKEELQLLLKDDKSFDSLMVIPGKAYSKGWNIDLKTFWQDNVEEIEVLTSVDFLDNCSKDVHLVISFEDNVNNQWYNITPQKCNLPIHTQQLKKRIKKSAMQQGVLKVYVWNSIEPTLQMENFHLDVRAVKSINK